MKPIHRLKALSLAGALLAASSFVNAAETSSVKIEYIAALGPADDTMVAHRTASRSFQVDLVDGSSPFTISNTKSTPYILGCEVSDNGEAPAPLTGDMDTGLMFTLSDPQVNAEGTAFSLTATIADLKSLQHATVEAGCTIDTPTVEAFTVEQAVKLLKDGSAVTLLLGNGAKLVLSAARSGS